MFLEGLIERAVEGVEMTALPIGSVLSSARCIVNNIVTDIETDAKCRAIDRESSASASVPSDEDKQAHTSDDTRAEFYKEILGRIVQHENSSVRNPIDIAIELGYSEEDALAALAYLEKEFGNSDSKE